MWQSGWQMQPGRSSFNWKWAVGLLVLFLIFSGAFRFILPALFFGFLFFMIVPKLLQVARGCSTNSQQRQHRHGWDWAAGSHGYRDEKRKHDFAQAVDGDYTDKPKRDHRAADDAAVEYVVGSDGELEPVRRPRRDDYV